MTIFLTIVGVVIFVVSVYGAYLAGKMKAHEEVSEIFNEMSELLEGLLGPIEHEDAEELDTEADR